MSEKSVKSIVKRIVWAGRNKANVSVRMQVFCEVGDVPLTDVMVRICPKPDKLEYNRTRKNLKQIAEGNFSDDPLIHFILKPQSNTMQYVFPEPARQLAETDLLLIGIKELLNKEQVRFCFISI